MPGYRKGVRSAGPWRRGAGLIGAALFCVAATAAQGADPALIAAGRAIVLGEAVPAEVACARCHGPVGEGNIRESAPRLAAQSRLYLSKQLDDFAAETRPHPLMGPIARALSPDQRDAAAAYFQAQRKVPWTPQPEVDPALLQAGGGLSGIGAAARGVRACIICHADAGKGLPPSFPYLAGQSPDYIASQMLAWKQGVRRNDPLDAMGEIARALSHEEIAAVALYFARSRPPLDSINRTEPTEPVPGSSTLSP